MRTSKSPAFPPRLEALRRRFKQWRRTRKIGSRIPEALWSSAVKLAEAHGIHPTAKALGVDYDSLKKRLDKKPVSGSPMVHRPAGPRLSNWRHLRRWPCRNASWSWQHSSYGGYARKRARLEFVEYETLLGA